MQENLMKVLFFIVMLMVLVIESIFFTQSADHPQQHNAGAIHTSAPATHPR
jgi:hypothetical protein